MQLTTPTPHAPRRSRGTRRTVGTFAAAVVLVITAVWFAPPASAAPISPTAVALSTSASCSQGDIEITYTGSDLERQVTTFTAEGGRVLHAYDVHTYAPNHDGLEYILSQTRQPPPAGTVVAVHVTIGESPAQADTTAEFYLAYTCDPRPNSAGGNNVVVATCVGMAGTCPKTAPSGELVVPTFTG